jgi:hypothetical protein
MDGIKPVVDRYIEIWNETNPPRRRALIALTWTDDASYLDPLMSGDGPEGIDAMIGAIKERYPDFRFRLAGEIDTHHDRVRFRWEAVPEGGEQPVAAGTDFGVVAADGRLQAVTGFLDQMPAG